MKGRLTDVTKQAPSVGRWCGGQKPRHLHDETGRYIIWKGSPAQREIREAVAKILHKHDFAKTTQLYKESSVYNFYVKVAPDPVPGPREDVLCPLAKSTGSASSDSWKVSAGKGPIKANK